MSALLDGRGFAIERCCDEVATRDGINGAWHRLIRDSQEQDTVVVYYSGHGGLAAASSGETAEPVSPIAKRPLRYQFIVPMDFDATTETDFRGISSPELSRLLRNLTERTRNVTLIMDCCHAARMSRDLGLTPKALPRTYYLGVAAHLERLHAQGLLEGRTFIEGNPDAVRVVAAATTESAYEYTNPQGRRVGVLTESLSIALGAAGEQPVSWRSVLLRVRERVLSVVRQQHPDVEGPAGRVLFGLDTVDVSGVLGVGVGSGRPVLRGGYLAGVETDDTYAVMPFGAEALNPTQQIAEATVIRVRATAADIRLSPETAKVPEGALAFPLRKALRRWAVRVEGDAPAAGALRSSISASKFVREAGTEEEDPPLATIRVSNGKVALLDRVGLPLVRPRSADQAAISDTIANLDNLAQAQHLLILGGGTGSHRLGVPVPIELGRVEAGHKLPLALSGETLMVGESLYLTLRNEGQTTIYASVFDIGVTGKVTLLSASSPSGIELPAGKAYTLGEDDYDTTLPGINLSWPETAPAEAPRRESLAVVLTSEAQDLRSLETATMRSATRSAAGRSGASSELARILEQVASGGMRDAGPPPSVADVRYDLCRVDFMLDPTPLAVPGLPVLSKWAVTDRGYIFDERPDRSLARAFPRTAEGVPGTLAVRLAEVVVHRNKALFGGADLRLDCMVVTGAMDGKVPYRVETARFPAIRDNQRLPMDDLLVFHGAVRDFLDIAVWISRDEPDSPPLVELLQRELNSNDFTTAADTLVGLGALGPQGVMAVVGIGATATLMSIGARLIVAAVGKSIGLYRTSLLANENFGVGRHPPRGLLRSQDFSFSYEVVSMGIGRPVGSNSC
jgi:hypothetical protein